MESPMQTEAEQIDAAAMLLDITAIKGAYTYSDLPEGSIRLLKLQPHHDITSPLQCSLIDYPLQNLAGSNHHLYDALSYAWGSPERNKSISIDNINLPITSNLHAALLQLRNCFFERTVWADAICINQQDIQERNNQVRHMAMIYAMASRVIVWLGEAEDSSDKALEEIHKSANGQRTIAGPTIRNAVLKLLLRPWFKRVWVLQEVAAARNVLMLCGSTEIDGHILCLGIHSLELNYEENPDLRDLIRSAAYLIRHAVFPPKRGANGPSRYSLNIAPLGELLDMYHTREASDRRDKVYALLGMSSDNYSSGELSPDYDIQWERLFQQAIRRIVSERVLVSTWKDTEVAVIRSKVCILGQVFSIKSDTTLGDKQNITISKFTPEWDSKKIAWLEQSMQLNRDKRHEAQNENIFWTFTLSAQAISIQKGDIICLLQGAPKPTVVRPYKDYLIIVAIAISPGTDKNTTETQDSWIKILHSVADFPQNLLLVWDWTIPLKGKGEEDKCLMSSQIFKDERPTQLLESGLIFNELKDYEKAVETLKRAIEGYEQEFSGDSSPTIATMAKLATLYRDLYLYEEELRWKRTVNILGGDRGVERMAADLINACDEEVLGFFINWRWDQVAITEYIVKAAAAAGTRDMMELLLDQRGAQIIITENVVKAATRSDDMMNLLLDRRGFQITITEDIVKAAATAREGMMNLLLDRRGDEFTITEDIIQAAAGNSYSGKEMIELLLDRRGNEFTITEDIIQAAVGNIYGREVIELLLDRRGDEITITEDIIQAAAGNLYSGKEVIELLLDWRGNEFTITEDIIQAAAGNLYSGKEVIELLLDWRGNEFTITEDIVKAAAGDRYPGSREKIKLLLKRRGGEITITEDIIAAANHSGVRELLLNWRGN